MLVDDHNEDDVQSCGTGDALASFLCAYTTTLLGGPAS